MPNNTDTDKYDRLPAEQRLATYIRDQLHDGPSKYSHRVELLAKLLGYQRPNTINMWARGRIPVPLKAIPKIAKSFGHNLSDVLPLWLSQEAAEFDDGDIYFTAKRMVDALEWNLITVARDIYEHYDWLEDMEERWNGDDPDLDQDDDGG